MSKPNPLAGFSDVEVQNEFWRRSLRTLPDQYLVSEIERREEARRKLRPKREIIRALPPHTVGFVKRVAARLGVNPRAILGKGPGIRGGARESRMRTIAARTSQLALGLTQQQVADLLGYGDHSAAGWACHRAEKNDSMKKDSDKLIERWKSLPKNQTNGK